MGTFCIKELCEKAFCSAEHWCFAKRLSNALIECMHALTLGRAMKKAALADIEAERHSSMVLSKLMCFGRRENCLLLV